MKFSLNVVALALERQTCLYQGGPQRILAANTTVPLSPFLFEAFEVQDEDRVSCPSVEATMFVERKSGNGNIEVGL